MTAEEPEAKNKSPVYEKPHRLGIFLYFNSKYEQILNHNNSGSEVFV